MVWYDYVVPGGVIYREWVSRGSDSDSILNKVVDGAEGNVQNYVNKGLNPIQQITSNVQSTSGNVMKIVLIAGAIWLVHKYG